jgi:hypothetical protein
MAKVAVGNTKYLYHHNITGKKDVKPLGKIIFHKAGHQ